MNENERKEQNDAEPQKHDDEARQGQGPDPRDRPGDKQGQEEVLAERASVPSVSLDPNGEFDLGDIGDDEEVDVSMTLDYDEDEFTREPEVLDFPAKRKVLTLRCDDLDPDSEAVKLIKAAGHPPARFTVTRDLPGGVEEVYEVELYDSDMISTALAALRLANEKGGSPVIRFLDLNTERVSAASEGA